MTFAAVPERPDRPCSFMPNPVGSKYIGGILMKKLIASVMMICLLCCAAVVIAETNTSGIMFLNIPWGSSVKEVQGHLEARANNDLSFEKSKPDYFLDREELGLYHNFNSDSLEYYVVPSSGLYFCDVYVDEMHLFFRDDKLVQAAYFFRCDPDNLKQMTAELDRQYGPHTLSVSKQITDVDLYKWEADGRSITAETVQIDAGILNYYSDIIVVYSDK
uniref:Uncharacterized protein n=1 Tax=uncultured bacterium Contig1761 TaxID=1393505 RepID=W0FNN5_9BACT|nr:hypothetical protein [uncultured bacterium Contig1761]